MSDLGDWEEYIDEETKKPYYFNKKTDRTSWTKPTPQSQQSVSEKQINVTEPTQRSEPVKVETSTVKPNSDPAPSGDKKTSKYKPLSDYAPARAIRLAPLGKILSKFCQVSMSCYRFTLVCFLFGLVTIVMDENRVNPPKYIGPAIYTFLIPIPIGIINCMTQFDRVDKSTEAILQAKEWPKWITIPFDILLHTFTQGIFYILISVYCFFCPQTIFPGMCLVFTGLMYWFSVCHCEKPKRITGLV